MKQKAREPVLKNIQMTNKLSKQHDKSLSMHEVLISKRFYKTNSSEWLKNN